MKNLKLTALLLTALVLVQCQDESLDDNQLNQEEIPEQILINLNEMGFDTDSKPVLRSEDGYLVEGDMFITTDDIMAFSTKHRYRRLTTCDEARDITIRNYMGNTDIIQAAIDDWNAVRGSFVKFRLVNGRGGDADVVIQTDDRIPGVGQAALPKNGKPGRFIKISLKKVLKSKRSGAVLLAAMKHELGHVIGFGHTDQNVGGVLSNTADSKSIMSCCKLYLKLTSGDKKALRMLYGNSNDLCK